MPIHSECSVYDKYFTKTIQTCLGNPLIYIRLLLYIIDCWENANSPCIIKWKRGKRKSKIFLELLYSYNLNIYSFFSCFNLHLHKYYPGKVPNYTLFTYPFSHRATLLPENNKPCIALSTLFSNLYTSHQINVRLIVLPVWTVCLPEFW